ncbi:hypothetical protein [Micromonospora sp. NPDC126480]|uniref:hypothetical protein n=1 Tax=Micromonospora sp. NPDC126480 TaxID=3155312 RepID=UPI003316F411
MSRRHRRGRLAPVLLTVLLAAVAACTADKGPERSGGEKRSARADPALLALGELLDENGALPVAQAQRMVAGLVQPLPDVQPWTVAGAESPALAGLALRRVAQALPTLDPPVAEAIEAITEPAADEEEEIVLQPGQARARTGATTAAPASVPSEEELTGVIAGVVAGIEERSGHRLRLPIRVRVVPDTRTRGDAVLVPMVAGDTVRACRMLLPRGLFGQDAASVTSTVAHEVWHCFQYDAVPLRRLDVAPLWIIEGQAEWAGETYVGGSPSSAGRWDTWLLQPAQALTRRSYDAIGLYAVAAAAGADPWRTALPMLGRRGAPAVETLFGQPPTLAVRRVATSLVRSPQLGDVWESSGPGITDARGAAQMTVPAGESREARMRVPAFGVLPVRLIASGGEVLRVAVEGGAAGAVAMPGAGTVELNPGGSALFCLVEGGCACPDGTVLEGVPQVTAGEGAAAVGAVTAGEVAVLAEYRTVEQECAASNLVGEWVTDVSNVMRMLSTQYGAMPSCRGPWVVTFTADGRFSAGYEATCRVNRVTGQARARFAGTYTDTGRSFTVSNVTGDGTMTIGGRTSPLPGVEGFRTALGGTADYVIDGDTLTYWFAAPDGKKPTIVLTRRS